MIKIMQICSRCGKKKYSSSTLESVRQFKLAQKYLIYPVCNNCGGDVHCEPAEDAAEDLHEQIVNDRKNLLKAWLNATTLSLVAIAMMLYFTKGNALYIYLLSSLTFSLFHINNLTRTDRRVNSKSYPMRSMAYYLDTNVGYDNKLSAKDDETMLILLKGSWAVAVSFLIVWLAGLVILWVKFHFEKQLSVLGVGFLLSFPAGWALSVAIYNIKKIIRR